ncbi:hypothetical protein ABZ137_40090 [Streptomyces bobili]|uniref:hypothetical protein n=1 Tax=Streptomyces bobili TaxID=67280 RepID=UPI0033BB9775
MSDDPSVPPEDARLQRIAEADDAVVLEAAHLLAAALGNVGGEAVDTPVLTHPLMHRADFVTLTRVALTLAAADEETAFLVDQALDGAGHKQLVLGGAELVAIGIMVSMIVTSLCARGRKEKRERITFERSPDGTEKFTIDTTVSYGSSLPLGQAVRALQNPPGEE